MFPHVRVVYGAQRQRGLPAQRGKIDAASPGQAPRLDGIHASELAAGEDESGLGRLHLLDKGGPDCADLGRKLDEAVAVFLGQVDGRLGEVQLEHLGHGLFLVGPDVVGHGRGQLLVKPRHCIELVHVLVHHVPGLARHPLRDAVGVRDAHKIGHVEHAAEDVAEAVEVADDGAVLLD